MVKKIVDDVEEAEEDEEQPVKKQVRGFGVADIPTESQRVIVDTETNEQYDLFSAVALLINKVNALNKKLG